MELFLEINRQTSIRRWQRQIAEIGRIFDAVISISQLSKEKSHRMIGDDTEEEICGVDFFFNSFTGENMSTLHAVIWI